MFESLVIMLREGIEIALIVGLMWVYLRKTGRSALIPAVVWGLAGGVAVSLGLAWALRSLDWSKPIVEGTMMFIAAVFVVSMVVWMMGHAREISGQIKEKIETLSEERTSNGAFWGVMFFTLIMVAREGFETVVFMAAVWAGTHSSLLNGIGPVLGLALAILFGVLFIRGSVHLDLGRFFKITGIILMIFIVQLLAYGLHEYGEAGLMAWAPHAAMTFIDRVAHDNIVFILALIAIPVLMLAMPGSQRQAGRSERGWRLAGAAAGVVVVGLLGVYEIGSRAQATENRRLLHPQADRVEVELADLRPGEPAVFAVPEDGRMLPLIVVRLSKSADPARPLVATGRTGAARQFGVLDRRLVFYDDDGEAFNPDQYEKAHLVRLQPVEFTLEGRDLYVNVKKLESAAE